MRVVLLTNPQGNQIALANKIAAMCDLAGVVVSDNVPRRGAGMVKRARLFANKLAGRTVGRRFVDTWSQTLRRYDDLYPDWPTADFTRVRNINDDGTLAALDRLKPDLVAVSGTNLVGRRVIEAARQRAGIVNLHTGISPYVRGGPNCTNWCLAMDRFDLIGSTVMWIDTGIDTGNIIATERAPLSGSESLADLHWVVMEHAHDLYVRAIGQIASGVEVPSVDQRTIAEGFHFRNVDWGFAAMRNASRNFDRNFKRYFAEKASSGDVRLVSLADA